MNRSTKRCLVASAGAHSMLLLTLVVGSAFKPKPPEPIPASNLNLIPSIIVENATAGGGGNPKLAPSDEKQKGDTLEPLPPPAQPEPVVPPPKKEVEKPPIKEPVKEAVKPPVKEPVKEPKEPVVAKARPEAKPAEPKPKNKISLEDLKPRKAQTPEKSAAETARENARKELASRIEQATGNLSSKTSGFNQGTVVEASGTGGAAYADYASIVKAIYDDAWIVTDGIPDDSSIVTVRVKIARDGDVIDARVTKPSNNSALNHTVEMALRKVKFVRPFPRETRDQQRTFTINFNLKGKRTIG
jgi:TonB family protein